MKCPACGRDEMKQLDDTFALGKAQNVSRADFPAFADKFTLRQAMYVYVNVCQSSECQHVSLTFRSLVDGF